MTDKADKPTPATAPAPPSGAGPRPRTWDPHWSDIQATLHRTGATKADLQRFRRRYLKSLRGTFMIEREDQPAMILPGQILDALGLEPGAAIAFRVVPARDGSCYLELER